MNPKIPVPKFVISSCPCTAEDGTEYPGLIVDAQVSPGVSNGYLYIDDPDHLFLLRDAVDAAIARRELTRPDNPTQSTLSPDEDETSEE